MKLRECVCMGFLLVVFVSPSFNPSEPARPEVFVSSCQQHSRLLQRQVVVAVVHVAVPDQTVVAVVAVVAAAAAAGRTDHTVAAVAAVVQRNHLRTAAAAAVALLLRLRLPGSLAAAGVAAEARKVVHQPAVPIAVPIHLHLRLHLRLHHQTRRLAAVLGERRQCTTLSIQGPTCLTYQPWTLVAAGVLPPTVVQPGAPAAGNDRQNDCQTGVRRALMGYCTFVDTA